MPPQHPPLPTCPYLGRVDDPDTIYLEPHPAHRCHATDPATEIELAHQRVFCHGDPVACARFIPPLSDGRRAAPRPVAAAAPTPEPSAPAAVGAPAGAPAWRRLSFEEWAVYAATGALVVAIAYFAFLRDPGAAPPADPRAGAAAVDTPTTAAGAPGPATAGRRPATAAGAALAADGLTAATAAPTARAAAPTPAPADIAEPLPTVPLPTPPPGGLVAALSPSERGVGSFSAQDRLPAYGDRNLRVGRYAGNDYLGGVLFPLTKLPKGSRVTFVQLELAGLSGSELAGSGDFTVEMLDPEAADDWVNLTYATLDGASAARTNVAWRVPRADLAPRRINVLQFSGAALDQLIQRQAQGKVAFRIRGPAGAGDNLYTWDTGYGQGFGTRPVLRVVFVPPPATATPAAGPGQPTALPLIVWISDPTPAPTTTPLPASVPDVLKGRILFLSDRFGQTRLMIYDPADGRVGQVTQSWPYTAAQVAQQSAAGVSVRVEGRPCGGETTHVGGREVLVDPDDPARTCAQLIITGPGDAPARELTQNGYIHYDPAVSPDGQWITYVSTLHGGDDIFKIQPDGKHNTRLTQNVWEWDKHPSWSPDGARIVFWSNRDGRKQLYIMNADGTDVRNISGNAFNDWDPVWVK